MPLSVVVPFTVDEPLTVDEPFVVVDAPAAEEAPAPKKKAKAKKAAPPKPKPTKDELSVIRKAAGTKGIKDLDRLLEMLTKFFAEHGEVLSFLLGGAKADTIALAPPASFVAPLPSS